VGGWECPKKKKKEGLSEDLVMVGTLTRFLVLWMGVQKEREGDKGSRTPRQEMKKTKKTGSSKKGERSTSRRVFFFFVFFLIKKKHPE